MPRFHVTVVAVYCGLAGSRWLEAIDQAQEWARQEGIPELTIGAPGCSVDHSVVPLAFPLTVESPSEQDIHDRVKAWAKQHPLNLRATTNVTRIAG